MDTASRIVTYIIIFLLFQLAGPPALSNEQLKTLAEYLEIVRAELDTLANVTVADFKQRNMSLATLNFTNIREYSADTPQRLHPPQLEAAIKDMWHDARHGKNFSVYLNPNAALQGRIDMGASLQSIDMPLPLFKSDQLPTWEPMPTPAAAIFFLELRNRQAMGHGEALIVDGLASFVPEISEGNGPLPQRHIPMRGIYLNSGQFMISTSSLKFMGPAVLPYVIGSEDARLAMFQLLNNTSLDSIDVYDAWQVLENQKSLAVEEPELIIYGQARIEETEKLSRHDLDAIEQELETPEGAPLPPIPRLICDSVAWSPDSGLNAIAKDTYGTRMEVLTARRRTVLVALLVVYVALTVLLGEVCLELASPSRAGKLSVWTAGAMTLMDGTVCLLQISGSESAETAPLNMAVGLFAFVLTIWFELDLVTRVYSAQVNESALARFQRDENEAEAASARAETGAEAETETENETETETGAGAGAGTAAAASISRSQRPVPRPTIEYIGEREISGRVYGRFYLALFVLVVTALVFGRSHTARYRYEATVFSLLYSFWVPQSWRSVSHGSQVPLGPRLICAITVFRLLPFVYLCGFENNVYGHHYRPVLTILLISWQGLQVGLLCLQRRFGPRFFLPRSWTVQGYDFHRLLTDDIERQDTAANTPRALGADPVELEFNETLQSYCRIVSCAICMESVTLLIHRGGPVTPAIEAERQKYMITPCRHAFHTECLEQWMESKLQCPVCRSPLPAI